MALLAEKAEVFYDSIKTTPQAICDWITSLGFASSLISADSSNGNGKRKDGGIEVELHIGGMTCSSCVYNIESHVNKLEGVIQARVALATQKGLFVYDPDLIGPRKIIEHIKVRITEILTSGLSNVTHQICCLYLLQFYSVKFTNANTDLIR